MHRPDEAPSAAAGRGARRAVVSPIAKDWPTPNTLWRAIAEAGGGFAIENILRVAPERSAARFFRTSAGTEIDLVLKLPKADLWAIEIKRGLSPKLERGFHNARADLQPAASFVV